MSDRLAELVRQRALVQEHLAWLNREIAAAAESAKSTTAAGKASPAPTAAAPLQPGVVSAAPLSPTPATPPVEAKAVDADEIIARYQATPASVKQDVRKGCLLYFAGAFVLLGLVVTVLYFTLSHRH